VAGNKSNYFVACAMMGLACGGCAGKKQQVFDVLVHGRTSEDAENALNSRFSRYSCGQKLQIAQRSGFHKIIDENRIIWEYSVARRFIFLETVTSRIQFELFSDTGACQFSVFQEGI
jgi:hypothetical protein